MRASRGSASTRTRSTSSMADGIVHLGVCAASRAGSSSAGCSVSRNATSAVASGGRQVFAIGRHVASALDHLANELVLSEPQSDAIERRSALAAQTIERMAVVALLALEDERAPALQSGSPLQVLRRNRQVAPGVHDRAPRRVNTQVVNLPNVTAMSRTVSTAMGRRLQLFSPSPAKNGRPSSTTSAMTGPIKRIGVSAAGGRNESTA